MDKPNPDNRLLNTDEKDQSEGAPYLKNDAVAHVGNAFCSQIQSPDYLKEVMDVISNVMEEIEKAEKLLKIKFESLAREIEMVSEYNIKSGKNIEYCRKYSMMEDRVKELEEKCTREQKRAMILEIENERKMEEIKSLRKQKNILLQKLEKNNTGFRNKIRDLLRRFDKQ